MAVFCINVAQAQSITLTPNSTGVSTEGRMYYDNVAKVFKYWNGTTFVILGSNWLVNGPDIYRNSKVGIGQSTPAGKLDILHNTTNLRTNPHLNLRTSSDASLGMIRMENSTGSRHFGQYFSLNSATPANNFLSIDYNGDTPILDLQGNGNVQISGFTKLGAGDDSPRIKIKAFSGSTSNSPTLNHGLGFSKILAISVLVEDATGDSPHQVATNQDINTLFM